jgi:tetratricopeptide (TPR) repeat protein
MATCRWMTTSFYRSYRGIRWRGREILTLSPGVASALTGPVQGFASDARSDRSRFAHQHAPARAGALGAGSRSAYRFSLRSSVLRARLASYLQAAGRHDEAIAHFHRAEERNPRSERLKMQVASAYSCAGRHEEAVAQITELQTRMGGVLRSGLVGDAAGTGLLGSAERQYSLMAGIMRRSRWQRKRSC